MERSLLLHIEKLSNIRMSERDVEKLELSIDESIKLMDSLLSVDTSGVEPFLGFLKLQSAKSDYSRLYDDIPEELPSVSDVLKNSRCKDDFIVVPKFLH